METLAFIAFVRLVVEGEMNTVSDQLHKNPLFAKMASPVGATRKESSPFFIEPISHYLYAGDTALHLAAAAFRRPMAELLIAHGADCLSKNRMGAEPLHYVADTNRPPAHGFENC